MKVMKILVYQPRASYYTGGGEVYPLQNCVFFSKLGHDVTLLTTKASFIKESDYFVKFKNENPNVKIDYLELDENYKNIYSLEAGVDWERWDEESLWVSRLAYEYLLNNKFDMVAIHNVIDDLAVPDNVRHVLHLHGSPNEMNYLCKMILKREKNLIAVSENVKDKWTSLGVNNPIKICTNAIDENMFFWNKDIERTNDLLFVGRLIPIKGVNYVIEAVKILKEEYGLNLNLSIIGCGPYSDTLVELTKKLELESNIKFLGLVSQEKLIEMYQSSKIAVLPSFEKEGIMSTLLEAASCHTPSITTCGTSMEEFAKNDINALLVNPKDAHDIALKIYNMYTDKNLYDMIADNSYNEVLTNYTWLGKCKEIINLYEDFK